MTSLANLHQALHRLIKPLMVICILLLAVGPVADGLICDLGIGDPGAVEQIADIGGGDDPQEPANDHAICAHGHCHHPVPLVGLAEVQTGARAYAQAAQPLLLTLEPPSNHPPSLKRPPRV